MTGIGIVRELMHWNRRITCGGKGPPSGAYWLSAMYNKPGMLQDVPGAGGVYGGYYGLAALLRRKSWVAPTMHKPGREGARLDDMFTVHAWSTRHRVLPWCRTRMSVTHQNTT